MSVKKNWGSCLTKFGLNTCVISCSGVQCWRGPLKNNSIKKNKTSTTKKNPLIIQLHNAWLWASRTRSWIYRGWEKSLRLLYMHVKRWRFNEQEAFKRSNRFLLELTFPFYTMQTKALDYQFKNKNNPQARDYTMDTRLLFYCSCLIWSSASW